VRSASAAGDKEPLSRRSRRSRRLKLQLHVISDFNRNVAFGSGAESLTRSKCGLHYPR
jgi:hypothetical protein